MKMSLLPFQCTDYFASLAVSRDPYKDPIAAQIIPRIEEEVHLDYETRDPLGDQLYEKTPRLIHHYVDRVLFLVNHQCATYCRFCFRRHFTGEKGQVVSKAEITLAAEYVAQRPEITEVILSGGDPLLIGVQAIRNILKAFRKDRPDLIFRIGSRLPVVSPGSINQQMRDVLKEYAPLWLTLHINHAREITTAFKENIESIRASGVSILSQTVLLKGINDSAEDLEALFKGLLRVGVKPYYLFQGDLASGTSHFRVNLRKGLNLMEQLRQRLSGMAIPNFALDLPGGKGKINLTEDRIVKEDQKWYYLKARDDSIVPYPNEE